MTVTGPAGALLEEVRGIFRVERVSVALVDPSAGTFEIAAEAGRPLLPPGTRLPLETCSYFAGAVDGEVFADGDFDGSRTFRRPLDEVIIAAGYHAGGSAPIRRGGRVVGALSLSDAHHREDMPALLGRLEATADDLLERLESASPALTPREQELLALLEEGLRFKQVARLLGISEATAKTHGRNLFRKLGASSRAEAVHLAREAGLLP